MRKLLYIGLTAWAMQGCIDDTSITPVPTDPIDEEVVEEEIPGMMSIAEITTAMQPFMGKWTSLCIRTIEGDKYEQDFRELDEARILKSGVDYYSANDSKCSGSIESTMIKTSEIKELFFLGHAGGDGDILKAEFASYQHINDRHQYLDEQDELFEEIYLVKDEEDSTIIIYESELWNSLLQAYFYKKTPQPPELGDEPNLLGTFYVRDSPDICEQAAVVGKGGILVYRLFGIMIDLAGNIDIEASLGFLNDESCTEMSKIGGTHWLEKADFGRVINLGEDHNEPLPYIFRVESHYYGAGQIFTADSDKNLHFDGLDYLTYEAWQAKYN